MIFLLHSTNQRSINKDQSASGLREGKSLDEGGSLSFLSASKQQKSAGGGNRFFLGDKMTDELWDLSPKLPELSSNKGSPGLVGGW